MSQQRDLPESMAWRVIGRLESGQTQRSVADAVGVARSVVARLWNRFQETGNVRRRPGAAAKTVALGHRTKGVQPNSTYRLHEGGLYARRPMVCIPLTPRYRVARRRWAAEHRDWEQHDWSQVLFTDESRFSLECDTRRVLVWRDRGTRNKPAFVHERSQYRRAGWMVFGGISIGGRTDLHIIRNGTLTGRRPPATVRDLEIALLEEWNSIPQSLIDNPIVSMENRCEAVLAVRGDHTPY
ncbi:transposable element Tcb2 transposase [Trichonephila clavipes]|nr:transposable element Tcb2 transposase [Trichonephila clavipes]